MQQDEHKNFQNWWRNAWDNWTQSWQPPKFNQPKFSQFEPTLKSYFFGGWDFSTFFFNHMSQKYQNEKSPILNGQKKSKTSEKVQKMRDLEGPTSFRPFENTLYKFSKFSNLPGYPLQDLPYNRVSLLLSEIENNNYKSWKHFNVHRNYFSRRKHEMMRKVKKYFFFKPL